MSDSYFFNFSKLKYIKEDKPAGCILCSIGNQQQEFVDLTVFRNPAFLVSVNLYPYNPGHILIFPKRHLEDVREMTAEESGILHKLQKHFLNILDLSHSPAGYNIGFNMGLVAGGSIRHLHLHIIPRYPNEIGLADLLAGKRVLVEDPRQTVQRLKSVSESYFADHPF